MSELEKNITDRLRDAASSGRVNPDELWASIEEQIDTAPPASTGASWTKGGFGLLLLVLVLGIWYSLSSRSDEAPTQVGNTFAAFELEASEQSNNLQSRKQNFELCFPETGVSKRVLPPPLAETTPVLMIHSTTDEPEILPRDKTLNPAIREDYSATNNAPALDQEILSLDPEGSMSITQRTEVSEASIATLSPKPLALLSHDDRFPSARLVMPNFTGNPLPQPSPEKPFKKETRSSFSLGGFVGLNTIKPRFQPSETSDIDAERAASLNDGYQLEPGVSAALEVNFQPGERLLLSTGIRYDRLTEEFNFRSDIDTVVSVFDGQDTTQLNAIRTRIIRHHNRQQSITVPLLLGLQLGKGKLQYGAQAGIGLNLTLSQRGRLLDAEGQLINYDQRSQEDALLPRAKVSVSYLLQPFIAYRLSDELSLVTRARLGYTNYGDRPLLDLKMRDLAAGLDFGVRWRF